MARQNAPDVLPAADSLLSPVTEIDGFLLACLVDASTGMVIAAAQNHEDLQLSAAAAGAADMADVLALLAGQLAASDGLDDVMMTFSNHFHLIRPVLPSAGPALLLLVILDRQRANLALARRELRNFCESLAG